MTKQALTYNTRINRYVGITSEGTYIEIDPADHRITAEPITPEQTRFGQAEADWLNQDDLRDPDNWSEDHPAYVTPLHHTGTPREMGWQ